MRKKRDNKSSTTNATAMQNQQGMMPNEQTDKTDNRLNWIDGFPRNKNLEEDIFKLYTPFSSPTGQAVLQYLRV